MIYFWRISPASPELRIKKSSVIIRLTTDPTNREYSDTAIFITDYLARIIRTPADLRNRDTLSLIQALAGSKLAIMDASGYIATVGDFISDHRLLYSNGSFMA